VEQHYGKPAMSEYTRDNLETWDCHDVVTVVLDLQAENQRLWERLWEALALANSMILSGEQHSEYSEKKIAQALHGEVNDE